MLGNYLKFNNVTFPNPITPTETSQVLENVNRSEAGTDLVVVVRSSKKSWNFNFKLTSRTRDILKGLAAAESTTMSYMGSSYTVRIRDYSEKLVENSEWLTRSEGLYEVSVKITEF